MANRAPTPQAAPQAASQETKSQVAAIQDQETAGNRPSSLPVSIFSNFPSAFGKGVCEWVWGWDWMGEGLEVTENLSRSA